MVSSSVVKWSGPEGHYLPPTSSEVKNERSYRPTSPPSTYRDIGEYVLPCSPHVQPLQVFQHKPLLLVFIVLWSSVICHLVWYRCVHCHTVTRFSWQAAGTVSAAIPPAVRYTGWSLCRRNGTHTIWINAFIFVYHGRFRIRRRKHVSGYER
jgi:hypothetical protein